MSPPCAFSGLWANVFLNMYGVLFFSKRMFNGAAIEIAEVVRGWAGLNSFRLPRLKEDNLREKMVCISAFVNWQFFERQPSYSNGFSIRQWRLEDKNFGVQMQPDPTRGRSTTLWSFQSNFTVTPASPISSKVLSIYLRYRSCKCDDTFLSCQIDMFLLFVISDSYSCYGVCFILMWESWCYLGCASCGTIRYSKRNRHVANGWGPNRNDPLTLSHVISAVTTSMPLPYIQYSRQHAFI